MSIRKRDTWLTTDLMPGFDDTHGYISLGIGHPATGPCSKADGVTISVKGQPDAKVVYTIGEPPKSTGGTSTSTRGSAYISGLKPGILAAGDVTATKAGCTLTAPIGAGRAKIVAGELTLYSFLMK